MILERLFCCPVAAQFCCPAAKRSETFWNVWIGKNGGQQLARGWIDWIGLPHVLGGRLEDGLPVFSAISGPCGIGGRWYCGGGGEWFWWRRWP